MKDKDQGTSPVKGDERREKEMRRVILNWILHQAGDTDGAVSESCLAFAG